MLEDNCRTAGNGSFAMLIFHLKQFLSCAKRLREATWLVMYSVSEQVVPKEGPNLERSGVRFS